MLIWVPTAEAAAALDGLAGPGTPVDLEQVAPGGKPLPASAAQVELYVPPFFPGQPAIAAMRQMPRLSVVQALTAGVDRLLAELPDGVTLCNARGAHDASTAEWVVAAILAALREFPRFALEQAAGRWSYQFTGCLAGQTVLIVGYGSIGAAVERRLAGFEVEVRRVARRARDGALPVSPGSQVGDLLPEADVGVRLGGRGPRWAPPRPRRRDPGEPGQPGRRPAPGGRRRRRARAGDQGDHRHGGCRVPGPDEGRRPARQRGPRVSGGDRRAVR